MNQNNNKFQLPPSWVLVRLGELVDSEKGKKPKHSSSFPTSEFSLPYVDIEAFESGILKTWTNGERCTLCNENDFLMVWDGSRSGLVGRGIKGALGSTLVKISFPQISNDYAYYFLKSKFLEINTRAKGSGTPHVDPDLLWNYDFPLPPLNEQCRIVAKIEELFTEIDKGIERLLKAKELLEGYRQSLLKSAFEGKLTEEWRAKNTEKQKEPSEIQEFIRDNRNEHHHCKNKTNSRKLKNLSVMTTEDLETLPKLPHNWVWDRLGWVTLGVEYGTSAKSDKEGNVAVLRMGNIQNGILSWDDLVFSSNTNEISKYSLKKGDVLFNRTNSPELVGKAAIYLGEQPAIFAGYLIRINHVESIVNGRYLTYYLNSPIAKQHGNRVKTDGVNQSNINGEKLINYPFPFCTLEEQNIITNILENHLSIADEVENEVKKAFDQANVLKQLILQKAFFGSLVLKDENDEPATTLLERIRTEKEPSIKPRKKSKQRQKVNI